MKQTLYDILEVSRDASFEDIEVAYAKRFEKLKSETSWDSNRLVMLNEAREVLSDAAKRAAYDASLETAAQQPEPRVHTAEIEDAPRSSSGWIVAGVIVLAVVIWWVMRDDSPPAEITGAQPVQEGVDFELGGEEETLVVLEGGDAAGLADEETISEIDAIYASEDEEAEEDALLGEVVDSEQVAAATPAPGGSAAIIGFWDCFEPVTGRTSEYGFSADGGLTINPPDGVMQSFAYDVAGQAVNIVDANPPRTLAIEDLAPRRLVLSSGAGQRLVCTR